MTFKFEGEFWIVRDKHSLERFCEAAGERLDQKGYTEYTWRNARTRTLRQNAALHAWMRALSIELNEKGLDMRVVLKDDVEIPWDQGRVKEHLFRPIMNALFEIESTTALETNQVTQVTDVLNRKLGEKFGIYIPFGSKKGSS